MSFGNFARHFDFADRSGDRDGGVWNPIVRRVAYGVGALLAAIVLMLALFVLAGRRSPPHRLPEALQAAPTPPAAGQFSDTTTDMANERLREAEELLRTLQREVETETAVAAALRDQVDSARRDLAELQRQRAENPAPEPRMAELGAAQRAEPHRSRPTSPPAHPKASAERRRYVKPHPPPQTPLDRLADDASRFIHRVGRWIGLIGK